MAVRLALVVEPGDRLLTDVATLFEADGALVEARLLRDRRRRSISRPKRGRPVSTRSDLGGRLGSTRSAPAAISAAATSAPAVTGTIRSTPASVATARQSVSAIRRVACRVLGAERRVRRSPRSSAARSARGSRARRRRHRPPRRGRSCTCRGDGGAGRAVSGSVSIQISSSAGRRTRMSARILPLRSSSAA